MPPPLTPRMRLLALFVWGATCVCCMAPAAPGADGPAQAASVDASTSAGRASGPETAVSAAKVAAVCETCAHDVNVTIVTEAGPQGGAPRAITHKLYSMNVDDQRAYDYVPTLNANYIAFLAALKPALLRWPSGYYSQTYQFTATGTGAGALTPELIDGFMNLCHAVGAKPLMAVNLATGTPQNAAQLVQFVNQSRNYGVTWWQLGNEPDVDGQDDAHNPNTYVEQFRAFRAAMLAADGNVKFVGAELMSGATVMGGYSPAHADWLTPIVEQTRDAPMDAIAWHHYPLDSSQTSTTSSAVLSAAHALQEHAPDWPPSGMDFPSMIFPRLRALKASLAPKAELWVDECAEDSGVAHGAGVSDRLVGALWTADLLGRMAEEGADAVFRYTFKGGSEHKFSLIDELDRPLPAYYSYWLYAQHFGDLVVQAASDDSAHVAVHASLRTQDNSLRVVLINKTTVSQRVHVALRGFVPMRSRGFELTGVSGDSSDVRLNQINLSLANIASGDRAIAPKDNADACPATVLTLPPLSVTLRVYDSV